MKKTVMMAGALITVVVFFFRLAAGAVEGVCHYGLSEGLTKNIPRFVCTVTVSS